MKAIINNLADKAIEVQYGTERMYRDMAKDKEDIIYCYDLIIFNIPAQYSIKENLGWLFDITIDNIKLYDDSGNLVQETSNYHTVSDVRISPENDLSINILTIHII